jgi:DNA-binding transcriptional ArsR family regulator
MNMASSRIIWDRGTAYDLFVSLEVLHQPAQFDVRRAWAAGVRARLPIAERELLEQSRLLFRIPVHWVYNLPEPKDGATALWALGQIPPGERLPALALGPAEPFDEAEAMLRAVAARGSWNEADREVLQAAYQAEDASEPTPSSKEQTAILDWWARAEEFGERYLESLRAYQEVFFAEEERRIRPALQQALSRAQQLAERLTLPDLLEELSEGLRFSDLAESARVVLAPSFWCTPLMVISMADAETRLFLFGARPADASLVPGEVVPDSLLRTLKALSDPTRLRILHYLVQKPLSPAELSRRLRLRAPTVTHHLSTLRLAGLVQLTLGEGKGMRTYRARTEAVAAVCAALQRFLTQSESN